MRTLTALVGSVGDPETNGAACQSWNRTMWDVGWIGQASDRHDIADWWQ